MLGEKLWRSGGTLTLHAIPKDGVTYSQLRADGTFCSVYLWAFFFWFLCQLGKFVSLFDNEMTLFIVFSLSCSSSLVLLHSFWYYKMLSHDLIFIYLFIYFCNRLHSRVFVFVVIGKFDNFPIVTAGLYVQKLLHFVVHLYRFLWLISLNIIT